jgi:Dullard-like phosphatase family protein
MAKLTHFKKTISFFYMSMENYRDSLGEKLTKSVSNENKCFLSIYLSFFINSLLFLFISLFFLLIKIIYLILSHFANFFILFFSSFSQVFTQVSRFKKRKSLKTDKNQQTNIPVQPQKLTLILDLDHTLICTSMNKIEKAKNYFIIDNKYFVYKRPFLDNFLTTLSQFCDLAIYTASIKDYADKIIDHIDKNKLITRRLYRTDCNFIDKYWYKDVKKFGYEENKCIIIDDAPHCHLQFKSI